MSQAYIEIGYKSGVVKTMNISIEVAGKLETLLLQKILTLSTDCGFILIRTSEIEFINVIIPEECYCGLNVPKYIKTVFESKAVVQ